ncbi:hypothetical protein LCGC14_1398230 [marine sediment metagenome]|uniref:Rhamnosyl O-methyltransferase n=1 Tax=marine sediment metagenome TaxID=412755 RepID=A0A0F9MZG5_9ZZZZ
MTWPAHPEICWGKPSEDNCADFHDETCKGHPGKPCTGGFDMEGFRKSKISDPYHIYFEKNRLWENITWLGVPMWKLPNDAMIIQEIIYETKPEAVIETGTGFGGSTLFYASILKLMGGGKVLTIDVRDDFKKYKYLNMVDWVLPFIGSSIDPDMVKGISELVEGRSTMVILDSCHSEEHVSKELDLYSGLVSVGNYLIVEDTHVGGNPVEWECGKGPMEAVKKFLEKDKRFEVDKSREKLVMTFNPFGWLKRIS